MPATNLFIEVANQKGVNSPTDPNPIVPPDLSPPATYQFNLYYLLFGNPDTYLRYASAKMEINIRQDGPPTSGTFRLSFLGYTTVPIDINATKETVLDAFTSLRSVGDGNAQISGNIVDGYTIEFIGARAGLAQPAITCDASACQPAATSVVKQSQLGGNGVNSRQLIDINQDRVATTNQFTEIGVPATPGWTTSVGLSTSGISQSFWVNPPYDIILEVKLFIGGARTGADGITSQLAQRNGADGVIGNDGRGRSGADGVISSDNGGRTIASCVLFASDYNGTYGGAPANSLMFPFVNGVPVSNSFSASDIGRTASNANIPAGATITAVIDLQGRADRNGNTPVYPKSGVRLSTMKTQSQLGSTQVTGQSVVLGNLIGTSYQSASANFTQADLGHIFTGDNIPAGTTILQVLNSTTVVLSNTPTAIGTALNWSIVAQISNKFTSATANFTALDVDRSITGDNIPPGTSIATFIDAQNVTLSNKPTAIGTALNWTLPAVMSKVYQSATAAFTNADAGKILASDNVPSNTTIVSVTDATHCVLSQIPTAAGTGLSWQIISIAPGSSAPPSITRLQAGTSSLPEIQRIAFAEIPDYGTLTITLNGTTSAPLTAPLDALSLANALNNTFPTLQSFVVVASAKCVFDVTFGVNGAQSLFAVDDTNVVYNNTVLKIVLVNGSGLTPVDTPDITILYDGDFSQAYAIGKPRITNLSDGSGAMEIRQRFMQLSANWRKQALNSGGPFGSFLIGEDSMEDVGAGIVTWDRVWATKPANRTEILQINRPGRIVFYQYSNGVLVDIQMVSISVSTPVNAIYEYFIGHPGGSSVPPWGPAGSVVHFSFPSGPTPPPQLIRFGDFPVQGDWYGAHTWNWTRRRWKGEIWEQVRYVN